MKTKEILIGIVLALAISGCTHLRIDMSDGRSITYDKNFMDVSAEKIDFFLENESTVVWVIANDPNGSVTPGKLTVAEPNTGINLTAEKE